MPTIPFLDRSLALAYRVRRSHAWAADRAAVAQRDPHACLRALLPSVPDGSWARLLAEFEAEQELRQLVDRHRDVLRKDWQGKLAGPARASIVYCYAALRVLRPRVVVETGCASGWLSALILAALRRNGEGHLYSIDIPPRLGHFQMDWGLPEGVESGFLVPPAWRNRWTLILGDARHHLPPLLEQLRDVGVFVHDSDHTYEHMMWEYTSVWPHLEPGGLLISDDIGWNTAFADFAAALRRKPVIHASNPNFGAIAKPRGDAP